jgi:hypothetical protein
MFLPSSSYISRFKAGGQFCGYVRALGVFADNSGMRSAMVGCLLYTTAYYTIQFWSLLAQATCSTTCPSIRNHFSSLLITKSILLLLPFKHAYLGYELPTRGMWCLSSSSCHQSLYTFISLSSSSSIMLSACTSSCYCFFLLNSTIWPCYSLPQYWLHYHLRSQPALPCDPLVFYRTVPNNSHVTVS